MGDFSNARDQIQKGFTDVMRATAEIEHFPGLTDDERDSVKRLGQQAAKLSKDLLFFADACASIEGQFEGKRFH